MPAFKATFDAAGSAPYKVVSCSYSFNRTIDDQGRPSTGVQGGTIKVTVVSVQNPKLISWMLDPYKRADGKIVFDRPEEKAKLKELSFKEAYCVGYEEIFDERGSAAQASMLLSLVISANKIEVDGATLDREWV